MHRSVQSARFLILRNAQASAEERLGRKADNCRGNAHIRHRYQHGKALVDKQGWVAGVQQAAKPVEGKAGEGENAREDAPDDAAHAMAAESIKRIVPTELALQHGDEEIADRRNDDAHDDGYHRIDEAASRCDNHQAGQDARAADDQSGLARCNALNDKPACRGRATGKKRVADGEGGISIGSQRRAAIEAEPTHEQNRSPA